MTYQKIEDIVAGVDNATQLVTNTINDDNTITTTGVDWFSYQGVTCTNIYVSGNAWLGFGANSEHLKINRRDTDLYNLWREEGVITNKRFLRYRWNGYSVHGTRNDTTKMTYDVILIEGGHVVLYMADIPSSGWDGTFVLNNGTNITYNAPTADNRWVTFKYADDSYTVSYEPLKLMKIRYLLKEGDAYYSYTDTERTALSVSGLTAQVFLDSGSENPPTAAVLSDMQHPSILYWQEEADGAPELSASVTATPPAQVIDKVIYKSDPSITGINNVKVTCEGDVRFACSFDDGATYQQYDGSSWNDVSDGMDKDTIEAITSDSWNEITNDAESFIMRVILAHDTDVFTELKVNFINITTQEV